MFQSTLAWATAAAVWMLSTAAPFTPEILLGGLVVGNAALIACVVSDCHGRSRGFRGPPRGFRGPPRGFRGPPRGFRGPSRG
ncbi:hypothetical protein FHG87_008301, partial [Trinorchestia longiramus]